ncbi:DNA-binding SARP family transcriptional activator [Nocardia sp. GAS34]|uniref:AfsR/SARP family transcriptional regulator n=1 Tax=unclassified Nocardia TaxID=2637762 RepID=UPI003D1DE03F
MRIRLSALGPLQIELNGSTAPPLRGREQATLAMLAFAPGHTLSTSDLIDGVWGEQRPASALAALRNYVSALRKALGPAASALESSAGHYRLRPDTPIEIDTDLVGRLLAEANDVRRIGDPEKASGLVHSTLARWRGEPLAGLPGPWAAAERSRLRRLRQTLRELAVTLMIDCGDYDGAITELEAMIAAHPLDEPLRALMMTALERSDRRAAALEVYRQISTLLAEELGLDPGPELVAAHTRLLADPTPAPTRTARDRVPLPAQLPPANADFTGRTALMDKLTGEMAGSSATAITAIAGMGGIGKTTLAVRVAHHIKDRFPDGQLFVDLRGADPDPSDPTVVLGEFLRALGVPESDVPSGLSARSALYRSVLSDRRVLVLLDNAHDSRQVAPLLPGTAGCATVITARRAITTSAGEAATALGLLSPDEAVDMFTRIIGTERAAAAPEAVVRIVELCGRLPLAIRTVAGRIAARPHWDLTSEADRLASDRADLSNFQSPDISLDQAFRSGYEQLDDEHARAFRMLAHAEVPELSLPVIAAVLDRDEDEAERLCEDLVDCGLLETGGRGRYHYHDLMRIFARDRRGDDADTDVLALLLDFYLASMKNLLAVRNPGGVVPAHPTGSTGVAFADIPATERFLDAERRNLVALYRLAARGTPAHQLLAADLAWGAAHSLAASDVTVDVEAALREFIAAAEGTAPAACRRAKVTLGLILVAELGQPDRGRILLREAMDGLDPHENVRLTATVYTLYGQASLYEEQYDRAAREFRTALDWCHEFSSASLTTIIHALLTTAYAESARDTEALAAAAAATDSRYGNSALRQVVWARSEAAWIRCRGGDDVGGLADFAAVLSIAQASGVPRYIAVANRRMAEAHLLANRPGDALDCADAAITACGNGRARYIHARALAARCEALIRLGRIAEADECLRSAQALVPGLVPATAGSGNHRT